MATVHAQTTHAHIVPVYQDVPAAPSPTLTNPDLILPDDPLSALSLSKRLGHEDTSGSRKRHHRSDSAGSTELGIATAVLVPQRLSVQATIVKSGSAVLYSGYEHGAPLSDIGEEDTSDGASTTKGDNNSRPNSPMQDSPTIEQPPKLRHKKRHSNMSGSSADSDDGTTWESFDTSQLMSNRVAADIEHARESADEEENQSRRGSKEFDEELAVLNDRAEKILENARKRLTHMEDNLTKARHSILLTTSRSIPNIYEAANSPSPSHQPAGSLYRSISQNAHRKNLRGGFPVKPNTSLAHTRTGSDNVVPSGMHRLSRIPDVRSVSALDYSGPRLNVVTPDLVKGAHSPSSSRSWNSPLRILPEEIDSPSTVRTSPDSNQQAYATYRGLGIHAAGTQGQEDLAQAVHENSSTPNSLDRSNSQSSTRELTEKMVEMKNRIAELKSKAQADSMKRRSVTSLKSDTPHNSTNEKPIGTSQWYSSSQGAGFAVGRSSGPAKEWRSISQQSHRRKDSLLDEDPQPVNPITPVTARYLDINGIPIEPSSTRTDRNTPNLAKRFDGDEGYEDEVDVDFESMVQPSNYEDAEEDLDDGDDDVAANEEEQIYLNEVLEESLQEIEPQVPTIPGEFLTEEIVGDEGLSHEDRLDAFDYENMFLHSAMGTYRGDTKSDDGSDAGSVETSRQTADSPTRGFVDDSEQDQTEIEDLHDDEIDTDEEMEAVMQSERSPALKSQIPSSPLGPMNNVNKKHLHPPGKPWLRVSRSNSTESTSSIATFATATEGASTPKDEEPIEILNWGNAPVQPQYPMQVRMQRFPQPPPPGKLPLANGHHRNTSNSSASLTSQVTNGHSHKRSASGSILNSIKIGRNSMSPTNIPERSVSASGHYRIFPSPPPVRTAPTNNRDRTYSIVSESSQRTPQASAFPSSIFNTPPKPQHQHHRSQPSITSSPTLPQSQNTSPRPAIANDRLPPPPQYPPPPIPLKANTTILLESLIKLADPHFSLSVDPATGQVSDFEEVDKELVLGLLRAVGGVCDGILKGQRHGDNEGEQIVEELRERLEMSRDVLFGEWADEGEYTEEMPVENEGLIRRST